MQETQVWSLGWEDTQEKGMGTHSSILVWRIPWTEEPGGLQFMGLQRIWYDWMTNTFTFANINRNHCIISYTEMNPLFFLMNPFLNSITDGA